MIASDLLIERDDDGEYIATDSFSTVYGNGPTCADAVRDYRLSRDEYLDFLGRHFQVPPHLLPEQFRRLTGVGS